MDKFKKLDLINYSYTLKKLNKLIRSFGSDESRCALATKLILMYGIRLGNEESAEGYVAERGDMSGKYVKTYGITTLKRRHVHVNYPDGECALKFIGKLQVSHYHEVNSDLLKSQLDILKSHSELEGWNTLFNVSMYKVRRFIKDHIHKDFTPKDLRMIRANIEAEGYSKRLLKREKVKTKTEFNNEVKEVCSYVSDILGNTPSVTKRSYINPKIWEDLRKLRMN